MLSDQSVEKKKECSFQVGQCRKLLILDLNNFAHVKPSYAKIGVTPSCEIVTVDLINVRESGSLAARLLIVVVTILNIFNKGL